MGSRKKGGPLGGGGLALDPVGAACCGAVELMSPVIIDELLTEPVGWSGGVPGGGSSGPARPQPAKARAKSVRQIRHVTRDGTAGSDKVPLYRRSLAERECGTPRCASRSLLLFERREPCLSRGRHIGRRRPAVTRAARDRVFDPEHGEDGLRQARLDALHLGQAQIFEPDLLV
jgi:hypothetical protein